MALTDLKIKKANANLVLLNSRRHGTGRSQCRRIICSRIYELEQIRFTPIGYSGRGITTGTMFGQTMSDLLTGMDRADLPLPITKLKSVPTAPIISRRCQSVFTADQFLKAI